MSESNKTYENFINIIFSKNPNPPCTFSIEFPEYETPFKVLMSLLVSGARKLYGDDINVSNISQEQFEELQCYIKSVGFIIKYNYTLPFINIWFEKSSLITNCKGIPIY